MHGSSGQRSWPSAEITSTLVWAYNNRAREHAAREDYASAIADFTAAISLASEYSIASFELANPSYERGLIRFELGLVLQSAGMVHRSDCGLRSGAGGASCVAARASRILLLPWNFKEMMPRAATTLKWPKIGKH